MAQTATSTKSRDISPAQGILITDMAEAWKDTPYAAVGPASIIGKQGDCSGSTWRIYVAAGLPYTYQMTSNFPAYVVQSKQFRELQPGEAWQDGDILYWSGHMAIYSTFSDDPADATLDRVNGAGNHWTQKNDMWTAFNTKGPAYGAYSSAFFFPGVAPRVFRYQK